MTYNYFLHVAYNILHIPDLIKGAESWWCVSRKAIVKDRVFLYKPSRGIVCCFEIIALIDHEPYCSAFQMNTAKVKILKVYNPPITAKEIKKIPNIKKQGFIARNFQAKSFLFSDNELAVMLLNYKRDKK